MSRKSLSDKDIKDIHPGFTVACDKCGSNRVIVENDMGWSESSESWGSVFLKYLECGAQEDIVIS